MRAFRFSLFLASMAGVLSAAAYLWTPLVSPKVPQLHLAAPSLRSSVLEPPLRIPPLTLAVPAIRHLLPAHVVGSALVRLPRLAPQVVVRQAAPAPAPPAPVVVHRSVAPPAPKVTAPKVVELPVPVHVAPAAPEAPPVEKPAPTPPVIVVPVPTPVPAPAPAVVAPDLVAPAASSTPPAETTPQPATNAPAAPAAPAITPPPTSAQTPPPSTTPPPTTPGPTPTPPPSDQSAKPGWGCGDKNHTHSGPNSADPQDSPCSK